MNGDGDKISDKKRVTERWAEHFENVLNQNRATGKDIEENEKSLRHLGCEGRFILGGRISHSTKRIKK